MAVSRSQLCLRVCVGGGVGGRPLGLRWMKETPDGHTGVQWMQHLHTSGGQTFTSITVGSLEQKLDSSARHGNNKRSHTDGSPCFISTGAQKISLPWIKYSVCVYVCVCVCECVYASLCSCVVRDIVRTKTQISK